MSALNNDLKNKIINEIKKTEKNLKLLKKITEKTENENNLFDLLKLFQDLNDFTMENTIYKLCTNNNLTNKTIDQRIQEYEYEKNIIKPFIPYLLFYSLCIS